MSQREACPDELEAPGGRSLVAYLELFEIDAICQWCVASAVVMAGLAVLTALRVASD